MRATYRKGLGAAGNVGAGALAQLLDRPLGVKGVSNPSAATRRRRPRDARSSARASIPLGVRTLGRAVSLLDYEDFARAFTGIAKAHAAVLPLRAGRTIVVTVAFDGRRPASTTSTDVAADATATRACEVLVARRHDATTFRLALKVAVDPAYEADAVLAGVEAALRAAYSLRRARLRRAGLPLGGRSRSRTRVAGRGRGRRRPALHRRDAVGLADRLLAQQPAVGAGRHARSPAELLMLDDAPLRLARGDDVSGSGLYTTEELYRLLPAVYRVRDAEQGGVLRELVDVLTEQVDVLAETSSSSTTTSSSRPAPTWVAPYIGDLVGYRTLHGVVPQVASPRAEVANTIRYRRRKGTVVGARAARARRHRLAGARGRVLRAARDDAVHEPRPAARRRDRRPARRRRGSSSPARSRPARSTASRTPARCAGSRSRSGRYNIPNVGIFLWRVAGAAARRLAARRRRRRRARASASTRSGPTSRCSPRRGPRPTITHLAEPLDVPLPLLRRFAGANLAALYGAGRSLLLAVESAGGSTRSPSPTSASATSPTTRPCPGAWAHEPQPADTHVAVDPVLGRVAFPAAPAAGETRLATFHYGSALAIGGGGYDRAASLETVEHGRAGRGRRPARPAARVGRRRRRGADPRQPPLRRAADDHGDDAGAGRGRPRRSCSRRRTARGRCSRAATSSSSRWSRTRPSSSTGSCSPARRS